MAGPRRITGPQRTMDMRKNARRVGANMPFQGGIGQGTVGGAPQNVGQPPTQNRAQCPPGQEPAKDRNTGAQICKPAQANIVGTVPVNNADRAIAPKPGIKPKGY